MGNWGGQRKGDEPPEPPSTGKEDPLLRRLLAAVVLLPLLGGLAFAAVLWITTDVPPPGAVRTPQASVLTWADGTELVRIAQEDRTSVPLEQVSSASRYAVLAAEDRDFYDQGALSLRGTARAFVENLRSGEITQGGSTITQQYARAAFLDRERTWLRKAKEAVIAVKLDLVSRWAPSGWPTSRRRWA